MLGKTCMKIARTAFIVTGGLFLTISAFGYFFWYKPTFNSHYKTVVFAANKASDKKESYLRIKQKALLAKDYITEHGFDEEHCFLLDMRIPSGKNRLFVYNLDKDSVEMAGLVTHGSGSGNGTGELVFSNTPNSYCTSLGKYKVGKSYYGNFGLAYKLYGLDKSNSKAFDRFVVLHAHDCVPDNEVAPFTICESQGCPTVSPAFLNQLKTYLDKSEAPILLWIYY
jgi:hypothetical protein